MESRKVFVWGAVMIALTAAGLGVAYYFLQEREPTLAQLLPRSELIVVVEFLEDLEVEGGREFKASVKSTLRGDAKGGDSLTIVQPGNAGKNARYLKNRDYVFLLAPLYNDVWLFVSPAEFTLTERGLRYAIDGRTVDEQSRAAFLSLIEKLPPPNQTAKRQTAAGRWLLVGSHGGSDYTMAVIDLQEVDKTWEGTLTATSPSMEAALLKSVSVKGDEVEVVLGGYEAQFNGRLVDGIVRGEVHQADVAVFPGQMLPTDSKSLKGRERPLPTAGQAGYHSALEEGTLEAIDAWLTAHPKSPLALDAYGMMIVLAMRLKSDEATLEKISQRYLAESREWGPKLATSAKWTIANALLERDVLPERAAEYFQAVIEEPGLLHWKLTSRRGLGFLKLKQGKEEEGAAELALLKKELPFDAATLLKLAQYYETKQQVERALPLFAELAVLPVMELECRQLLKVDGKVDETRLPSAVVSKLWKQKHGKEEGLEAYLDQVYTDGMKFFKPEKFPPRPPSPTNRVSVVEAMTGTACAPCAGADVALDFIEQAFDQTEVIVLCYHQHIPALDPFATRVGRAKLEGYHGDRTPLLYINGKVNGYPGGGLGTAELLYKTLRRDLEATLREPAKYQLELSARSKDGSITFNATGSGPTPLGPDMRMVFVLAEEEVQYTGANGVRVHRMIVREVPGGPNGMVPDGDHWELGNTINLYDVQRTLRADLKEVHDEDGKVPEIMDLRKLVLVAFIQDEKTHEIFQAAAVRLDGLPPAKAEK